MYNNNNNNNNNNKKQVQHLFRKYKTNLQYKYILKEVKKMYPKN